MALRTASRLRQRTALALFLGLFALLVSVTGRARLPRADFVMNNGTEITSLDPATATGVPEGRVLYALFEGLTVKDPRTLAPLPGMASAWELSADGLRYTFHIRPEARWSDGGALSAHDFVWSWERLLHPLTAAEYAYQLWPVRGAREYTRLPIDVELAAAPESGAWLRPRPPAGGRERLRVGITGFRLGDLPSEAPVRALVGAGAELDAGAALVALGDIALSLPFAGRVTAVNGALGASVGALAEDPYEAHWLCEVEPDADGLVGARARGELVSSDAFRPLVWERRVGIRAPDARTLEVELAAPTPYFIHLVGFYPLFPVDRRSIEDARARWPDTWQVEWLRPENIVTNGPYVIVERRVNDRIRLRKNPEYWDRDNVAMRTIDVLAVEHYVTMLNLYLTGEVDWIDRCAPNLIPRLRAREDFDPQPYLGSYFYRVNVRRPPLTDVRVRTALALTIDRRAICEKVMKKGEVPSWSLSPPGLYEARPEMPHAPVGADLADYDAAFAADCARARALLLEAGYGPAGRAFPTIEIHYNTSEAHRDCAEVIADGWRRRLGIDAKLLNQEWKVYLDTQRTLGYDVSRSSWVGDYPDPNTFLDVWLTGGENNRTGWGDPRYDELVSAASREPDPARRLELLGSAEALLLEELPVLPIYGYVSQNLVKPRLGGFFENLQDEHMPKFLFWMDDEELARKRAALPTDRVVVAPGGPPEGLYAPAAARLRSGGTDG